MIERTCEICSAPFKTFPSKVKIGKGKFCSRQCYETDWKKRIPGWNKGKPAPWAIGNDWRKGKSNPNPHTMSGEENPAWKGKKVGYYGLHNWVRYNLGTPHRCDHCGNNNLKPRQYHWANKSRKYKRDLNDWLRLCVKCHIAYDKESI